MRSTGYGMDTSRSLFNSLIGIGETPASVPMLQGSSDRMSRRNHEGATLRSTARIWQNWWMLLVAGLLIMCLTVLPWLWVGDDKAIFPHASTDALGILIVFAVATLWCGYFVRRIGKRRTSFAVVADVGLVLAVLGFTAQALYAMNPKIFAGQISSASIGHLWAVGLVFVASQVMYFLIAKLPLAPVAPIAAILTTGISLWIQVTASLISGAQSYIEYLSYAGPLVLGLVLGHLGFLKVSHLLIWVLSLAIQWVMPAVFTALAGLGRSKTSSVTKFFDHVGSGILDTDWQWPSLVTLATAMLTSVVLLIVRKVRRRSY